MRKSPLVLFLLLLASGHASAATAAGPGALALAALVGEHSPLLPPRARTELGRLLDGRTRFPYPAHSKIDVRADSVVCRASDVDITLHTCELTFGKRKVSLNGRAAHALYATVAEVGVKPDGAAGSIYESLARLACTVDPHTVAEKAGGGADCTFNPGPP